MSGSIIVVMGVSGSGKTTIGQLLAKSLGWDFADADSFHSQANIEKMRAGIPLCDADRQPWLDAIKNWIDQRLVSGTNAVVTCSALKQTYREGLAAGRDQVKFVYLKGSPALIRERLRHRSGHFMPMALLDSQFETLEEPEQSDNTIVVSIEPAPEDIVRKILDELARSVNQGSKKGGCKSREDRHDFGR